MLDNVSMRDYYQIHKVPNEDEGGESFERSIKTGKTKT